MISPKEVNSKPSVGDLAQKNNSANDRKSSLYSGKNGRVNIQSNETIELLNNDGSNNYDIPVESVLLNNDLNEKYASEIILNMKTKSIDQGKKRPITAKALKNNDSRLTSSKGMHNCQSNQKNSLVRSSTNTENMYSVKDYDNKSRVSYNSKENDKTKFKAKQKDIRNYHKELKNFYKKDTLSKYSKTSLEKSKGEQDNDRFNSIPTEELERLEDMNTKLRQFSVTILDADKPFTYDEVSSKLRELDSVVPLKGSATHSLSNKISREYRKHPTDKEIVDYALIEQFNNALNEIVGVDQGLSISTESSQGKIDFNDTNFNSQNASKLLKSRTFSCGNDINRESLCFSPMQKLVDKIVEENEDFEEPVGSMKERIDQLTDQKIRGNKIRPQSVKVDRRCPKISGGSEKKLRQINPKDFAAFTLPDDLQDLCMNEFTLDANQNELKNHTTSQIKAYSFVIQQVIKNANENQIKMRNAKTIQNNENLFDSLLMDHTFGEKSRLTVETIKLMKEKFNKVLMKYCRIEQKKDKIPILKNSPRKANKPPKGSFTIEKFQKTVNFQQNQKERQKKSLEEQTKDFIMNEDINLNNAETVSHNLDKEEGKSIGSFDNHLNLDDSVKYDAFNVYGGNQIHFKTNENKNRLVESRREGEMIILKDKMNVYLDNCRKCDEIKDRNLNRNSPFKSMKFNRDFEAPNNTNEYLKYKALQDYQKEYRTLDRNQKLKMKYLNNKIEMFEHNALNLSKLDNDSYNKYIKQNNDSPRLTSSGLWKIESDKPIQTEYQTAVCKKKYDPFGQFDTSDKMMHPFVHGRAIKNSPPRQPDVKIKGAELGVKKVLDRQKIRAKNSSLIRQTDNIYNNKNPLFYSSYRDSTDSLLKTEGFDQAVTADSLYVRYIPKKNYKRISSAHRDPKKKIKNAMDNNSVSHLDNSEILVTTHIPNTRNMYLDKQNTMFMESSLNTDPTLMKAASRDSSLSKEHMLKKPNLDPYLPFGNNLNDPSEREIARKKKINLTNLKKPNVNLKSSVTKDNIGDFIAESSLPNAMLKEQISSGIRELKHGLKTSESKKRGSVNTDIRKIRPKSTYGKNSLQCIASGTKIDNNKKKQFNKFMSFCDSKHDNKTEVFIQLFDKEKSQNDQTVTENSMSKNLLAQSTEKALIENSNLKSSAHKTLVSTAANTNLENSHFKFTEQKEKVKPMKFNVNSNKNHKQSYEKAKQIKIDAIMGKTVSTNISPDRSRVKSPGRNSNKYSIKCGNRSRSRKNMSTSIDAHDISLGYATLQKRRTQKGNNDNKKSVEQIRNGYQTKAFHTMAYCVLNTK